MQQMDLSESQKQARALGLKPKSKATLDELIADPKISQTEAYLRHHKTTNRDVAAVKAAELVRKGSAQIYLQKHIGKAKRRIVDLIDSDKDEVALKASDSVLDRALGKPIQSLQIQNTSVNINIDLTGEQQSTA